MKIIKIKYKRMLKVLLKSLWQTAKILPQINQNFVNPRDQQLEIVRYNQAPK
ncbi:MAG: hypothetical protein LBL38_03610 [Lactobacillales bacterium]|jgi:diketogulonate reductase-like aldo/keto reductase|nr:hypothetical protein [Lactobacillales bacterium]